MNISEITALDKEYLFQNYGDRFPVCFKSGKGSILFDTEGNRYIDFLTGIAVNSLGYGDELYTAALKQQIDHILHSSNLFHNEQQCIAAKLLSEHSYKGRTLFVNSGTEANEAAIKLARRYGTSKDEKRYRILSFKKSFHGRTFGAMSATAQEKIHTGFGPVVPGFEYLPYNNIQAVMDEVGKKNVCAVIIELIQGEGGIHCANQTFVTELSALCSENDVLLIIDEIQTGIGRTGKPFAYQQYGIQPDIITIAKGLGGGIPTGAMHAREELCAHFPAGAHGTTFGGNHFAMAAAAAVLSRLDEELMKHVNDISDLFFHRLNKLKESDKRITDVRGKGLHIGIEMTFKGRNLVKKALNEGLIINCTADNVIRLLPALTITRDEAEEGLSLFEKILKDFRED